MITMISDTEANYLYQDCSYHLLLRTASTSTNRLSKKLFLDNQFVAELKGILTLEELALRIHTRHLVDKTNTNQVVYSFGKDYVAIKYPELLL
jgi:hypothetical protein